MDDVLGQRLLTGGDEDLRTLDVVGAVGLLEGLRTGSADVRARVLLGEVHRAGPLPAVHLLEVDALHRVVAELLDEVRRAHGQTRGHHEGEGGAGEHLHRGEGDDLGQAHAAPLHGRARSDHAGLAERIVGALEALGHLDFVGFDVELDAFLVADLVDRRDHLAGELVGQVDDHVVHLAALTQLGVVEALELGKLVRLENLIEQETHVAHVDLVLAHGIPPQNLGCQNGPAAARIALPVVAARPCLSRAS